MPTVLLAEDRPDVVDVAARMLAALGFDAHPVSTAEEGIRYAVESPTAPALVMADYKLAGGTGLEVLRAAWRRWPDVPGLLVSGSIPAEIQRVEGRLPARLRFVMKPYGIDTLDRAIGILLGRPKDSSLLRAS